MAISPVTVGDTGALARAKINAAIEKANLVDGLEADKLAIASAEIDPIARPGDAPNAFTSSIAGDGVGLAFPPAGALVTNADGAALRASGEEIIAGRRNISVEPGRIYGARWVFRRYANPDDPAGDATRVVLAWLDNNKALISETEVFEGVVSTFEGQKIVQTTFSPTETATITAPSGACYVRPYIQTFGASNSRVDIESIDCWVSNGLPGPKGDEGDVTPEAEAARDAAVAAAVTAEAAAITATTRLKWVADRAELKALDVDEETQAYLVEDGREGVFIWRDGDYSAEIAADPDEGIYIEADDVGSSDGAWVRENISRTTGTFGSRAEAQQYIGPSTKRVVLYGFAAPGDCPETTYEEVVDSGTLYLDQFQSADGRRWQIVSGSVDVRSVGMVPASQSAAEDNATILNALIARKRAIVIPSLTFYLDGTIRLISGTQIHGVTPRGVTWKNIADGVVQTFANVSRLVCLGTHTAAFDSAGDASVQHGAMSNLSIMAPEEADIDWLFLMTGMLDWTFENMAMETSAGENPGGFASIAYGTLGANPSFLNTFTNCSIRVPDDSTAYVLSFMWTDSKLIACNFTGGAGCYYYGQGNIEVLGGNSERARTGGFAWTVDKRLAGPMAIKFIGVNFDENKSGGLLVIGANAPTADYLGVTCIGCHFRNGPAAGHTEYSDVSFIGHASLRIPGPTFIGNHHSVTGPTPYSIDWSKWDAIIADNIYPSGTPTETYTPSITVGSGSLTSATASLRYSRRGRFMKFWATVTITTNGTAAGSLSISLPFAVLGTQCFAGRETASTGNVLSATASGSALGIATSANAYPGADGRTLKISGEIELA